MTTFFQLFHKIQALQESTMSVDLEIEKTPQELLKLKPGASMEETMERWKYFAKKYHPDRGGDPKIMTFLNKILDKIKEQEKLQQPNDRRTNTKYTGLSGDGTYRTPPKPKPTTTKPTPLYSYKPITI
jgi:curved DNA-binding protein CbpA